MGRLKAACLAYEHSVLSTNPAAARKHSNIRDSITNWCVALVCRSNPAGLPTAPTALAGASGVGQNFRIEPTFLKPVSLARPDVGLLGATDSRNCSRASSDSSHASKDSRQSGSMRRKRRPMTTASLHTTSALARKVWAVVPGSSNCILPAPSTAADPK